MLGEGAAGTVYAVEDMRTGTQFSLKAFSPRKEKSDIYSLGVIFFRMLTGIWYEPGSAALELLDMYDYHWDKVLPWMLDADPTARPPWLDRRKMLGGQIGKRPKP